MSLDRLHGNVGEVVPVLIEVLDFDLDVFHLLVHPLDFAPHGLGLVETLTAGVGPIEVHEQILPGLQQSVVPPLELPSLAQIRLILTIGRVRVLVNGQKSQEECYWHHVVTKHFFELYLFY